MIILLASATLCLIGFAVVMAIGDRQERLDHERRIGGSS